MAHHHTLAFSAELPEDEMERASILGHPDVKAAREALHVAFRTAGADHKSMSAVKRVGVRGKKAPKSVVRAAE